MSENMSASQMNSNTCLSRDDDHLKKIDLSIFTDNSQSKLSYKIVSNRHSIKRMSDLSKTSQLTLIQIINQNLKRSVLPIKETCNRLEGRLRRIVSETSSKYTKLKGLKKYDYLTETVKIAVFKDEVITPAEIREQQKKDTKQNNEHQITILYNQILKLGTQIIFLSKETKEKDILLSNYVSKNQLLNQYVEKIRQQFPNTGKKIGYLGDTQCTKKISVLKERVQKALWFAKSFGITFTEINGTDENGKIYDLLGSKVNTNYTNFSEYEREKVKNILFILDSFCISDEAYHELTLQNKDMLKSYLIKQCRENVNDTFSILQTPGPNQGAQLDLFETLDRLLENITIQGNHDQIPKVRLKFAADGAKVSRISSFLVLSLAILNNGDEVMSSSGQHTLAIISSDEKYFTLKECFQTIFEQINSLLREKNGEILYETESHKKFNLEFFLGGDMKFLLTVLGLNAANSKYACLYCKIDKKERADMSKAEEFYWSEHIARTIGEMNTLCKKKTKNFGCIHTPLLNIDLSHVIVDELHMLMRICDVLLRNLIEDAVDTDHKNSIGQKGESKKCITELTQSIRECGISFSIWENRVKDGRGDFLKNLEWTSLTGSDCKKLIHKLPSQLEQKKTV